MATVKRDDLPNEELKMVADNCGMFVAISLCVNMKGISINVPKQPFRELVKSRIWEKYDGTTDSLNKIAREYKYSKRYLYKMLKDHPKKKSNAKE